MRLRPEDEVELLRADGAKLQARVKELEDNLAAATARRQAVLGRRWKPSSVSRMRSCSQTTTMTCGQEATSVELIDCSNCVSAHQARRAALASPSDAAKALLERLVTLESMVGAWTAQKAAAVKEATDLKVAHEAPGCRA